MRYAMRHTMLRATVWAAALALLPVLATAQQPDPDAMARGGQLFGETCARCHNPRPSAERGDRAWRTIIMHMRARANLTKADAEAILVFLQATNGSPQQTSARDEGSEEDAELAMWEALAWQLAGVVGLPVPSAAALEPVTARKLTDDLDPVRAP